MPVIDLHELSREDVSSIIGSIGEILNGKSFKLPIKVAIVYDCCEADAHIFSEAVERLGGIASMLSPKNVRALGSYDLIISFLSDGSPKLPEHKPVLQFSSQEGSPIAAFADIYALLKSRKEVSKLLVAGELSSNTAKSFVVLAAKLGIKLALVDTEKNGNGIQTKYLEKAREYSIVSKYEKASEAGDVDAVYLIAPEGSYKGIFPNAFYSISYNGNGNEVLAAAMSVILHLLHKQ